MQINRDLRCACCIFSVAHCADDIYSFDPFSLNHSLAIQFTIQFICTTKHDRENEIKMWLVPTQSQFFISMLFMINVSIHAECRSPLNTLIHPLFNNCNGWCSQATKNEILLDLFFNFSSVHTFSALDWWLLNIYIAIDQCVQEAICALYFIA